MKKIYCNECDYYGYHITGGYPTQTWIPACICENNKEYIDTYHSRTHRYKEDSSNKNKNNDCVDFKESKQITKLGK